jgi:hypothetical protein
MPGKIVRHILLYEEAAFKVAGLEDYSVDHFSQ